MRATEALIHDPDNDPIGTLVLPGGVIDKVVRGIPQKVMFTGFDALPPPRSCWDVLGVAKGASRDVIEGAFRTRARMLHPDRGGSNEDMAELNKARLDALNQCA